MFQRGASLDDIVPAHYTRPASSFSDRLGGTMTSDTTSAARARATRARRLAGRRGLAVLAAAGILGALLASTRDAAAEKAGPGMVNLRLGPAFQLRGPSFTQFSIGPDFGYAVTDDNNAYILFSPQFMVSTATVILIPMGFEYDVALPVKGLYVGTCLAGRSMWSMSHLVLPRWGA
jgi:hypothetical protein